MRKLLALLFLIPASLHAACHAVGPSATGAGTGADWNNQMAFPAATSFIRGDIYYLADGSYGSHSLSTTASGTTTIEIRKAQSYDNGSSCSASIAAGWNTSTMGSSQAVFTKTTPSVLSFTTSYWILNGNGQQANPGCGGTPSTSGSTPYANEPSTPSDCGIRVDASSCTGGTGACNADAIAFQTVTNITLDYDEIVGNGNNVTESGLIGYFGTDSNITSFHVFGRNAGCVYYIPVGNTQLTSFSYFWRTATDPVSNTCHAQYSSSFGTNSNMIEHDNVYRDINGSAVFSTTDPSGGLHTGFVFYNNVFWQTSGNPYTTTGLDDGVWGVLQGTATGMLIYQNTFINLSGNSTGFYGSSPGQSATFENNLIYGTSNFGFGNLTGTEDYNSFLNSGSAGTGAHDVQVTSGAPNPFVSWTTGNFNLASENSDWTGRVFIGAPYEVDPNGTVRSTDRGAYQFISLTGNSSLSGGAVISLGAILH